MTLPYPDNPYSISRELNFTTNFLLENSVCTWAANLPCAWFRIQLNWAHIEQTQGNYFWSLSQGVALDESIQRVNAAGMNAHFTITGPPSFRQSQSWGGGYTYASAQEMHDFAVLVATRYQTGSSHGVLSCIEIGNEDYSVIKDTYHKGYWLAQAMDVCYPAIKAIDPNMLVGMGAQLQTSTSWVPTWEAQVYNGNSGLGITGVGANADFSNTHYYRGNLKDPTDSSYPNTFTIANQINAIHTADVNGGFPTRDCRITEYGWAANTGGTGNDITYALQSQYLLDVVDAARQSGVVSHVSIYTMDYPDANSIVASPTVSYQAYSDLQAYIAQYPQWGTGQTSTLSVSPPSAAFVTSVGSNPAAQTVSLTNNDTIAGSFTTAITYTSGSGWLSTAPASGTLGAGQSQTITLSVTSSTLTAGVYNATITWTMGVNTATCAISLTVNSGSSNLSASPTSLLYTGVAGGKNPATQNVILTNTSGSSGTWAETITYGAGGSGWLSLSPTGGTIGSGAHVTVVVTASLGSLAIGTYTATINWTMGANTASTSVTFIISHTSGLVVFQPNTVIASADMNNNFAALNTIATLTIPFVTFSSDNGIIQSDGNGNLVWNGGFGHGSFLDLYDGTTTTVTIKNTLATGTIHFQVPSGTDIATINSTEWTLATGKFALSIGSLARTSTFIGSGSGVYNHGNGGTPNVVLVTTNVLGFQRTEYDFSGVSSSSQVKVNVDGGLGIWVFCEGF